MPIADQLLIFHDLLSKMRDQQQKSKRCRIFQNEVKKQWWVTDMKLLGIKMTISMRYSEVHFHKPSGATLVIFN